MKRFFLFSLLLIGVFCLFSCSDMNEAFDGKNAMSVNSPFGLSVDSASNRYKELLYIANFRKDSNKQSVNLK